MKCEQCGCEFEPKTPTQRFHATSCRIAYHNEERRLNKLADDANRIIGKLRSVRGDSRHGTLVKALLREIQGNASY